MKLYLSSQKIGNKKEKLLSMCWDNKNIAIIANAIDDKDDNFRTNRVQKEIKEMESLWFIVEELDLRNFFNNPQWLKEFLLKKSMLWIRWWSAFLLNRAFIQSWFYEVWMDLIKKSKLVYAGYSAAIIVANIDLFWTEYVDNPNILPEKYDPKINPYKWLGLIDFYIIPHIDSTEEWAKNIPTYIHFLKNKWLNYITLKDWEVFIVDS